MWQAKKSTTHVGKAVHGDSVSTGNGSSHLSERGRKRFAQQFEGDGLKESGTENDAGEFWMRHVSGGRDLETKLVLITI